MYKLIKVETHVNDRGLWGHKTEQTEEMQCICVHLQFSTW